MASTSQLGPISQQYAAAATVPLIKSPSLWLPKPIELPDIHPLPEDITAYFVYPFTLEEHVLSLQPSAHDAIAQRRARNAEILHRREVEEEQKERDVMKKIAPGYNPTSLLVPTHTNQPHQSALTNTNSTIQNTNTQATSVVQSKDPMDELVAQFEEIEAWQ